MIDSIKLLSAIDRRVKSWNIERTFKSGLVANIYARNLMDTKQASGVRIATRQGDLFAIFAWIKDVK